MGKNDDPLDDLLGAARRRARAAKSEDDDLTKGELGDLLDTAKLRAKARLEAGEPSPRPAQKRSGMSMTDILVLPQEQRDLIQWLLRNPGSTPAAMQAGMGWDAQQLEDTLDVLKAMQCIEWIEDKGETFYTMVLKRKTSPGRT
jgi:hypothetical protein